MNHEIKPGLSLTLTKKVLQDDTAARYGSGLVEVFATPAMIAFMEQTALRTILPFLPGGYNSVGTAVDIVHLKATPVDAEVTCTATVVSAEGRKIVFQVEVIDAEGMAGKGTHTRYIINTSEFMAKVSGKGGK